MSGDSMIYYHCTPLKLRTGSVVEPGNWARILGYYRTDVADNEMRLYRELAYESARLQLAPAAPSRLSCLFACPTLEEAIAFRNANQQLGIINSVEPLDRAVATHVADWSLFGQPRGAGLEDLVVAIRRYWTEAPQLNREILIGGAVRIVDQH